MFLLSASDSLQSGLSSTSTTINIWMILALVELAIIVYLLLDKYLKPSKKSAMKKKILADGDVDFGNIVDSAFNARTLYHDLIIKCHPDRFAPDDTKMQIANELSARLTEYQHDIQAMNAIKEEAVEKLNINI